MRYITVPELREYAEQEVTSVIVHRSKNGYALVVRLNWRDEEHLLVSINDRKPRQWSSFDRLVTFLEREGVRVKELVVKFID